MEQVHVVRHQQHVERESGAQHEVQVVVTLIVDVMEVVQVVHVQHHVLQDHIVQHDQVVVQNV